MKKTINNKGIATHAVILIVAGTVVLGTAGGVVGYNVYQDQKHEKEVVAFMETIDAARNNTINDYNTRIEQAMSEITYTDENGNVITIESNRNIDSMNNVINNLNAVLNDLNNDALLSQEQKDAIVMSINDKINTVNTRIEVVSEENRIAEEEARKAAEAEAAKAAENGNTSSSKKGSADNNESSSDNSNGGYRGYSSYEEWYARAPKWEEGSFRYQHDQGVRAMVEHAKTHRGTVTENGVTIIENGVVKPEFVEYYGE